MTRRYLDRTIFVSCMLLVFAGSAKAEIAQCIDDNELVSFQDAPCQSAADAARADRALRTAPVRPAASPQAENSAAAEAARVAAWAIKRPVKQRMLLDITTLQAARSSMASMDLDVVMARQKTGMQLKSRAQTGRTF